MVFKVGERVAEHARSTARHGRSGEVREVLGEEVPRYRIRWDDGHESIYTAASGALRAGPGRKPRARRPEGERDLVAGPFPIVFGCVALARLRADGLGLMCTMPGSGRLRTDHRSAFQPCRRDVAGGLGGS